MIERSRKQILESNKNSPRDSLARTVAGNSNWDGSASGAGLYGPGGQRKYLNQDERRRVLKAAARFDAEDELFVVLLAYIGARVSEILALTPCSFQLEASVVSVVTLKRRKFVVREIPVPTWLMARLDRHFGLRRKQAGERAAHTRLWTWCRQTAWRVTKRIMAVAGIAGRHACPRGLRHAFGVGTLQSGVPLNLIQRWMGHSRLTTTAIYASVCGPEEIGFARRFWDASLPAPITPRVRAF
jgi:integrase/recombinase XerD